MSRKRVGKSGFYFPTLYQKNQKKIETQLEQGEVDYADITRWSFPDEFLCFVMKSQLFQFIDRTYPNPRVKNEIPIWFLATCQFIMRLHQTGNYNHLRYLLNAGSILTRFGFNVGASKIGFNDKNKKIRQTAVDADSVRKFFKDTKPSEIREWYQKDLQSWFRIQKSFDHHGIFILDQSHLVVSDNENYIDAVKMPVDEHGQLYRNLSKLTAEQKKTLVYHRCYAFSALLNVGFEQDFFHVAGYELGPGNEDELIQAERLIPSFCEKFPGTIKLLIIDRGYIDGAFIHKLQQDHQIDVLIPIRSDMDAYADSVALANMKNNWETIELEADKEAKIILKKEICSISDIELWRPLKLYALVTRYTRYHEGKNEYEEHYSVLVSTKKYAIAKEIVMHYDLRIKIEERFRQLKRSWYISDFPSPHAALVESHVCFTLLTYSLLQLYLRREDLQEQTHKMIETLHRDEQLGTDAVVIYAGCHFGVFDLDDYTIRVAGLLETPRQRLVNLMHTQKKERLKKQRI